MIIFLSQSTLFSFYNLRIVVNGVDTRGEKEKKTSKKNVDGRCTSSHEAEADQWLNRKEWRLGSGRRRQLSQDRKDR